MIAKLLKSVIGILLSVLSISCSSREQNKELEFTASKVYSSVSCQLDTACKYALFLPPAYKKGTPCPILILFDPAGDGLFALNQFKDEAAKNGFIIAGSNNSKNGMTFDQTTAIFKSMISDLTTRFSVIKEAVYLGGFSGGSRVSAAIAFTESGIAGIVGCGAGLPGMNQKPKSKFSYLAVVGNQDFNYSEMVYLDKSLEQAGYQHHLLVFDGIHQWPPKDIIPEIFTWLRFDAMRQHAIAANRHEIDSFIDKTDSIAGTLSAKGKLPQKLSMYNKMVHFLQGLTDVTPIQTEIARLSSDKEVVAYIEKQAKLNELEQELQLKYTAAILNQPLAWWNKEVKSLEGLSLKTDNSDLSHVYKRVLGVLSMDCYTYSTGALKEGNLPSAGRLIELYRLVDPTNAEHRYLAAKLAARTHNAENVYSSLKQAFELGFTNRIRIKNDPDFTSYQADTVFQKLISGNQ